MQSTRAPTKCPTLMKLSTLKYYSELKGSCNYLNHPMEQSPSAESDSHTHCASQEVPHLLVNLRFITVLTIDCYSIFMNPLYSLLPCYHMLPIWYYPPICA